MAYAGRPSTSGGGLFQRGGKAGLSFDWRKIETGYDKKNDRAGGKNDKIFRLTVVNLN